MDRPAPKTPVPASNLPVDADALPPSPAQRAKLLLILIILPVLVVSLPAILVTCVFGQRPKEKEKVYDTRGLHDALNHTAEQGLPTPPALVDEPIRLTSRPDRLTNRAERVAQLAKSFGGQANEFLAGEGEKHFFVELPPGRGAAFRQSLVNGDAAPAAGSPAAPTAVTAVKDQVEVFIRATQDDE